MHENQSPALLSTEEAAEKLGVTSHTLTTWRSRKTVNIPYVRVGRLVRYRTSDIQDFIKANVHVEDVKP